MDDSDQDFIDLCSKPLKRVRKKPTEGKNRPKAEQKSASQASGREKRKVNLKDDVIASGSKFARTQSDHSALGVAQEVVCLGAGGDAGGTQKAEKQVRAKDKVLQRMQQFKRASPQKMVLTVQTASTTTEKNDRCVALNDQPACLSPDLHPEPQDSDEALALRMQQDLDREAAQAQMVDLEDGGLFFCHICGRDLTHMTPGGRSLHVNRCLDESEESAPAPPPPAAPSVPDCPICGKRFKSHKSRSAHLKRCSSDMGVAPAALLQAVQRQAEESQSVSTAGRVSEATGTKRKGSSKTAQQARKKPRQKTEPLDEETMVALALSSSLLQQQKKAEQRATQVEVITAAPELKWRTDAGKGRGKKKKKGAASRPPPLLLIQDAEVALARLQERVSTLLLRHRPPSPPTPTRSPSRLPGWSGAAPLWQKSSLLEGATMRLSDFYTPELADFITPWEPTASDAAQTPSCSAKSDSLVPTASEGTSVPEAGTTTSITSNITSSQTFVSSHLAPPTLQTQPVDQTEEVIQHGCTASFPEKVSTGVTSNLRLSGFIPEEHVGLQTSGFLPMTQSHSDHHPPRARTNQEERQQPSVALSRLSSDLSSMVNNPQLSDLQLQVDNGDVYFAHSFMVYARCPLLAEMVHESGFGVQEDGMPAAQRVLLSDVPGQAVLVLLQYLYTAQYSAPASLQRHVLELASRFDLKELQELCELHPGGGDDKCELSQEDTDQAFVALLRSMWSEGDDDEGAGEAEERAAASTEEKGEEREEQTGERPGVELAAEEKVNEEELEEIYEFAATQRKMDISDEEEEEEEEQDLGDKGAEPRPDISLDGYSRLFSASWGTFEDGDAGSVSKSPPESSPVTKLPPESTSAGRPSRPADSALLQSSSSVLNEPSLSPPCNLPVPGRSPGQEGHGQGAEPAEEPPLPLSVCRPDRKKEPELIVLSDSSSEEVAEEEEQKGEEQKGEEQEEVQTCRSSSPPSPTHLSYTHIKPQLPPPGSEVSPDMAGCSPEVSWLLPSTPPQQLRQSVANSSASTRSRSGSGGCRTRLFSSLPAPPVFSPHDQQPSVSPLPVQGTSSCLPPDVAPPSSRSSSSSHLTREPLACPLSQSRHSPSDTPLRPHLQPCSSTPLLHLEHREAPPPPLLPATSPLRHTSSSRRPTGSGSSEGAEPGSFHLSPLSNCSSSRSSVLSGRSTGSEVAEEGGRVQEEAESSFHQSFQMMDEPPMAFNDSWGLDAGGDDQGRFSLRLDSGGSSRQQEAASSSSSASFHRQAPPPGCCSASPSPPRTSHSSSSTAAVAAAAAAAAAPHDFTSKTPPEIGSSLLDSKLWDSWREEQEEQEEEEEDDDLPLTQRLNPAAELRTPTAQSSSRRRRCRSLVPITPMPHYSDMDTPELKNKLDRFGVRPLPKRQMILKLKEIHQYTHQLASSDSEDEDRRPPAQVAAFKEPRAPPAASPVKSNGAGKEAGQASDEAEPLSASQGSSASSMAASDESERSNPEVGPSSSDGDSEADLGVSASQAATRLQDRLKAVRDFILSDPELYSQILRYRPLVLSTFQARLKAAGIRLGAAKLADYLDSQCITFTTAKPGQAAAGRRKGGRKAGTTGRSRKAGAAAVN